MKFLDMFIEDCRYYDQKDIELKTILRHTKLKGKTLLDIDAGIGRLSFPLSKHVKKVISLDKDKRFREYFKRHKKKNVRFVNQKAESYLKKRKNQKRFDMIVWAWPEFSKFDFKIIGLIKSSIGKDGIFILITPTNKSDLAKSMNELDVIKNYRQKKSKKSQFIEQISKRFIVVMKKKLSTSYIYPNKKIAFMVLKNDMKLFSNAKLNKKSEDKLREIINKHKKRGKNKKIIFGEGVWLYLMRKK